VNLVPVFNINDSWGGNFYQGDV